MGMERSEHAQDAESVSIYLKKTTSKSVPSAKIWLATIRGRIEGVE